MTQQITYKEADKKLKRTPYLKRMVKKAGFAHYSEAIEFLNDDMSKSMTDIFKILGIATSKFYEDIHTLREIGFKINNRNIYNGAARETAVRRYELQEAMEGIRGF